MKQKLACGVLAFVTLVAATPEPAAQVPAPSGDRVNAFAGPWACRNVEGVLVRETGARQGDTITAHDDVERNGKHSAFEDRYVFDPALKRWHVETGLGGFSGDAIPWTGDTWIVQGQNADGVAVRMTAEAIPGGDFRRTFAYAKDGGWFAYSVERCTPGTTPPAADACIAARYPATTLYAAPIQNSEIPFGAHGGTVTVVVALDASSHITGTRVLRSTSPLLNGLALEKTRASQFRTAIVNCKPVAADYLFTVSVRD
ncbi:MAG TPA: hypothetical protein VHS78_09330 [Candidatus Elarobacter sp.]|nr:hypothetical protein [Candidatus Elarobacter sp.]